jgi:DNA-binding response OmpR family regulator
MSFPLYGEDAVLAVSEAAERTALTALLQAEGVTVYQAATGREVIHMIEDHMPRLLIVDVRLPDVHAWRLLASIAELRPNPQPAIIVLSDEPITAPQQFVRLVVRPVSTTTLKQIIRECAV